MSPRRCSSLKDLKTAAPRKCTFHGYNDEEELRKRCNKGIHP